MAASTTLANVLELLPARTRCGIAFDQIPAEQSRQINLIGNQLNAFIWTAHHRAAALVPWTVCWSNGTHQIAMSLKSSPGAWSASRCFFDRLPPLVAQAAIAACFKPLVSTFTSGPWIELSALPNRLVLGGVDAVAISDETNAAFECEFVFSSPFAAEFVATSLRQIRLDDEPHNLPIACEVRLRKLHLAFSRLQALRVGDVLIGGVRNARAESYPACNTKVEQIARAVLYAAFSRRALAILAHEQGCWRVVSLNQNFWRESPMQDDEFLFDDVSQTESEEGTHIATPGLNLADLKVGVDIVACRLPMTVTAIQALRPGSVLELANDLEESPIEIRVGGQHFAVGYLIALDGRLAVQITAVNSKPSLPVQS